MAQGFYTLDEAAAQLGVSTDQIDQLVREKKLERLNAGGTWRFRAKDVDALAHDMGIGGPASSKKISVLKLAPDDALDFDLTPGGGSQVGLGDPPSSSMKSKPSPASRPPSTGTGGSGGDSDLRLVLENGSFEFDLTVDSDPRLDAGGASSGRLKPEGGSSGRLTPKNDSQVRLDFDGPTLGNDSLRLAGKPDSDARLHEAGAPLEENSVRTEEIDLDAEIRQNELESQARKTKVGPQGGQKTSVSDAKRPNTQIPDPGSSGLLPTTSPFELSEADIDLGSSDSGTGASGLGGSEFELTLAPEDDVELSIDEDIDLGASPSKSDLNSNRSELSGINLHTPADSGMEIASDASDEVDFELTLDDGPGTSSGGASGPKTLRGKLSDLTSDASEFELTMDEGEKGGDDKDIFETDFELPALDEDSASQAVALEEGDTDLESSDFDLAVDLDEDAASESQAVALDGDSLDTPQRGKTKVAPRSGASNFEDVDKLSDEEFDEEEVESAAVAAAPTEWGIFPIVMMIPCVIIMMMAGLMSYEILHGMGGYHQTTKPSGLLVRAWASLFVDPKDFPKE
jgi:excisionase family DNA binding protein